MGTVVLKTRKATCDGCGKVRRCTQPADKTREVMHQADGRKKLLTPAEHKVEFGKLIHYYWLCSECFPQVETQADVAALRRARGPRTPKPRFAYPCIGGPLDGEHVTSGDFYGEGMYAHLNREYVAYNASGGGGPRRIGPPSMIYIHTSQLKPLISPRAR